MLAVLFAQFLIADSVYATPALRDLVARVAAENLTIPASLHSYSARAESEIAVATPRPDGFEGVLSVEQMQGDVRWQRGGDFEQHLAAYRAHHMAPSPSALAFWRRPWTIPLLYGDRLSQWFGLDSARASFHDDIPGAQGQRQPAAIHPFGPTRGAIYRFSGGDTIAIIRHDGAEIPIARIHVIPRFQRPSRQVVVFQGEVDVDARRGAIVRMRGSFITLGPRGAVRPRVALLPIDVVTFVELENVEIDGRYWLPKYQRIEMHVALRGVGDARSAFRIVTLFRAHRVNAEPGWRADAGEVGDLQEPESTPGPDGLQPDSRHLTIGSRAELSQPADWWRPLGAATDHLRAVDFQDVSPEAGAEPRLALTAPHLADYAHFNRIEGLSTGLAGRLVLRGGSAPVTTSARVAWAWSEGTARGRLDTEWQRGAWTTGLRVARTLDVTNDFGAPFDSGGTFMAALFTVDDYDYVDRRATTASLSRHFGAQRRSWVSFELGAASDGAAMTHVSHGLLRGDSLFRPNRGVQAGRYGRASMVIGFNSDVTGEFVRPGTGGLLRYEAASGELSWQRVEARVNTRREAGPMTYALRFDAGLLFSKMPPPQQLFELGRGAGLSAYGYKEFAGDRAAVLRGLAMYALPVGRAPIRLFGAPLLPALSPALAFGVQTGLTSASPAARRAIAQLGSMNDQVGSSAAPIGTDAPVSRPTDGLRTSVEAGLRFFGGSVGFGVSRAVDHHAPWRLMLSIARGI